MATITNAELTTAQLSARTGLPSATLRMWESRHGFPSPARLPGGHRRYSEQDAQAVLEVLALREQGLSLPAAIDRARRREQPGERSVFAGLRRLRPDLSASVVRKRRLVALSYAIEDEYLAHAGRGLVFGCFQRERFYRASEARWRELARTARLAIVVADYFADFADSADSASAEQAPAQVPLRVSDPLAREWTLIVDAPGAHACVSAWEHPAVGVDADGDRRFELIWSFEPEIVRCASQIAGELLAELAPSLTARLPDALTELSPGDGLAFGSALAHRIFDYAAAVPERSTPEAAATGSPSGPDRPAASDSRASARS